MTDAFAERGLSIKHTETAPPDIARALDYQAASRAVQLRLATPDVLMRNASVARDACYRPQQPMGRFAAVS